MATNILLFDLDWSLLDATTLSETQASVSSTMSEQVSASSVEPIVIEKSETDFQHGQTTLTFRNATLTLEKGEGGQFIVADDETGVFGAGLSIYEAIGDYESMVWDLYVELEASESILSQSLLERLAHLRHLLE